MRISSPALRFCVAMAAALVVGGATWRAIGRAERRHGLTGPSARVLALRKAVPAGRPLTPDALEAKVIPAAFAEPGAFAEPSQVDGARARINLVRGEQLTHSKIESAASRLGLAWSLAPGQTALALRLPPEGAVGGHVLPGDIVSVLAPHKNGGPSGIVVRRARVAAVQERLWDPAGAPPSPPAELVANESFLVTLMLTPDQAVRVAAAGETSRLTLALLSPLDDGGTKESDDGR